MNVTREVILDLFPVYLAGEASPATRALVEEYLKQDAELAQQLRAQYADNFLAAVPSALPPELELRSLRRTRKLMALQRWLMGFAIGLTLLAGSFEFSFEGAQFKEAHFVMQDYPIQFGFFLGAGLVFWLAYFLVRRRLRVNP